MPTDTRASRGCFSRAALCPSRRVPAPPRCAPLPVAWAACGRVAAAARGAEKQLTVRLPRQSGEPTLHLVEKIRSLAKSATELFSRGVVEASEFLHAKLLEGTPLRAPSRLSARVPAGLTRRAQRSATCPWTT